MCIFLLEKETLFHGPQENLESRSWMAVRGLLLSKSLSQAPSPPAPAASLQSCLSATRGPWRGVQCWAGFPRD